MEVNKLSKTMELLSLHLNWVLNLFRLDIPYVYGYAVLADSLALFAHTIEVITPISFINSIAMRKRNKSSIISCYSCITMKGYSTCGVKLAKCSPRLIIDEIVDLIKGTLNCINSISPHIPSLRLRW